MAPEDQQAIAECFRLMLMAFATDDRANILSIIQICKHCGADERFPLRHCQCQNDD